MGSICCRDTNNNPVPLKRMLTRYPTLNADIATRYTIGTQIGQGSFGKVRLCSPLNNPSKILAVKTLKKSHVKYLRKMRKEVDYLASLDHPNIVRLYEYYENTKNVHIVIEYCSGGDLSTKIISKGYYGEKEAANIIKKILRAVNHLHKVKICHRDIKCENFMFESEEDDAELKLIDFGLSNKFNDLQMTSIVGTPYYIAPEVLNGFYGPECDI